MSLYVFAEGKTEERVLEGIRQRILPDLALRVVKAGGKDQVNHQMTDTLAPLLQGDDPIRCLVLRDLDEHTGETVTAIVQGVHDAVRNMIQQRMSAYPSVTLTRHPDHAAVYTLALPIPDLRLALHVATYRWRTEFIKATIDDYVLSMAAQPTTAGALIAGKGWSVAPEEVLHKVTAEIPALLDANGILLQEAKDYIRLYAAVIQEHTSPPVFASRTLKHADETDLRRVLAPLLAAIAFLRS